MSGWAHHIFLDFCVQKLCHRKHCQSEGTKILIKSQQICFLSKWVFVQIQENILPFPLPTWMGNSLCLYGWALLLACLFLAGGSNCQDESDVCEAIFFICKKDIYIPNTFSLSRTERTWKQQFPYIESPSL